MLELTVVICLFVKGLMMALTVGLKIESTAMDAAMMMMAPMTMRETHQTVVVLCFAAAGGDGAVESGSSKMLKSPVGSYSMLR